MDKWKNGKMETLKHGTMENWKNRKMETLDADQLETLTNNVSNMGY